MLHADGFTKVSFRQDGLRQVGTPQVGRTQEGPPQVGCTQIGPVQVGPFYGPSGDVKWDEADPTYSVGAAKRGG